MKHHVLFVFSVLLGSLTLAGCGLSGQTHPAAANISGPHVQPTVSTSSRPPAPSSTATSPSFSATKSSSSEPSTSSVSGNTASASTSSAGGSTAPPGHSSTSSTPIEYTVNQQSSIAQAQPQAWVARKGFNSHYVSVHTATASTSHGTVWVLAYSNFTLQETGTADSFGTGGNIVKRSKVSLIIPGFGSSTPITGTMTTVDGIQNSGPHSVLTFRAADGVYFDLLSNTLSPSQIEQIAESMSEI